MVPRPQFETKPNSQSSVHDQLYGIEPWPERLQGYRQPSNWFLSLSSQLPPLPNDVGNREKMFFGMVLLLPILGVLALVSARICLPPSTSAMKDKAYTTMIFTTTAFGSTTGIAQSDNVIDCVYADCSRQTTSLTTAVPTMSGASIDDAIPMSTTAFHGTQPNTLVDLSSAAVSISTFTGTSTRRGLASRVTCSFMFEHVDYNGLDLVSDLPNKNGSFRPAQTKLAHDAFSTHVRKAIAFGAGNEVDAEDVRLVLSRSPASDSVSVVATIAPLSTMQADRVAERLLNVFNNSLLPESDVPSTDAVDAVANVSMRRFARILTNVSVHTDRIEDLTRSVMTTKQRSRVEVFRPNAKSRQFGSSLKSPGIIIMLSVLCVILAAVTCMFAISRSKSTTVAGSTATAWIWPFRKVEHDASDDLLWSWDRCIRRHRYAPTTRADASDASKVEHDASYDLLWSWDRCIRRQRYAPTTGADASDASRSRAFVQSDSRSFTLGVSAGAKNSPRLRNPVPFATVTNSPSIRQEFDLEPRLRNPDQSLGRHTYEACRSASAVKL